MNRPKSEAPPPKEKKGPPEEDKGPPEDSIPLRSIVAAMAVICVATSCYFVHTNILLLLLYVWGSISGSFVSYQYRNEKNQWIHYTVVAGVFAVLANFAHELVQGFDSGKFEVLAPIVHQVAGTFALHTFELKTRNDINMSSALGLALICLTAPMGKGLIFGGCVLVYVILGAIMLYYDCISRTLASWVARPPIARAAVMAEASPKRRRPRGSVILTIAFLPILSVACFLFVPRGDRLVSQIAAFAKSYIEDPFAEKEMEMPGKLPPDKPHSKYEPKKEKLKPPEPKKQRKMTPAELKKQKEEERKRKEEEERLKKEEEARKKDEERKRLEEEKRKKAEEERKRKEEEARKKKEEEDRKREEERKKREEEARKREEERKRQEEERKKREEERRRREEERKKKDPAKLSPDEKKRLEEQRKKDEEQRKKDEEARKRAEEQRKKEEEERKRKEAEERKRKEEEERKKLDEEARKKKEEEDRKKAEEEARKKEEEEKKKQKKPIVKPDIKQEKQPKVEIDPAKADQNMGLLERAKDPETLLFKVTSNRTIYLRRFCFDTTDGRMWTVSDTGDLTNFTKPEKGPYDLSTAPALALQKGFQSLPLDQDYSIEADMGTVIAAGWVPQKVEYAGKKISVDVYGTIRGTDEIKKGAKFKITSQLPIYTLDTMRKARRPSDDEEKKLREQYKNYLQLPEDHSDEVTALAQKLGGDANWFTQAENICKYLRATCAYQSVEKQPDENTINNFILNNHAGDCEDFASAFVVMCRSVGIPTRCVAGYAPGDVNALTGQHEIKIKHAHAWGEAYIPGSGWVPFDATPDGYMPAQAKEMAYDFDSLQKKIMNQPNKPNEDQKGFKITPFGIFATSFGLIIAAILAFFVFRALKALFDKWQTYLATLNPSTKLFLKVQKILKKSLKVTRQPQDTPSDFNNRVKTAIDERLKNGQPVSNNLSPTLTKFLDVYSSCYFGNKRQYKDLEKLSDDIHELVKNGKGR